MDRSLECEAFPLWMARHLGGKALVTSADPSKDEIIALMEEIGNATSIVMGTYNGHLKPRSAGPGERHGGNRTSCGGGCPEKSV